MNTPVRTIPYDSLHQLRREWSIYLLGCVMFLAAGYTLLREGWRADLALYWLGVASAVCLYLFADLWQWLGENRLKENEAAPVLPGLGLPNGLTIIRGIFNAALAGFLVGPLPAGWLAWAPGALYITSIFLDYLDGYAARITRRTTRLGEKLDMRCDEVGMAVGVTLSVLYGRTPIPYLLVGLARPLYLFGLWMHSRQGKPLYSLSPSRFRRAQAGVQMAVIGVVLLPFYLPLSTRLIAILFMLPFLTGFFRDFLVVTGRIPFQKASLTNFRDGWRKSLTMIIPLLARSVLAGLLGSQLLRLIPAGVPGTIEVFFLGLAALALIFGIAGRAVGLLVLLSAGWLLRLNPMDWHYWLIFLFSSILFMTGTGTFSLWKPEEWLLDHRAGEVLQPGLLEQ